MTVCSFLAQVFLALSTTFIGETSAADPGCGAAAGVNLLFDGDSISAGWGASPPNQLDARVAAGLGGNVRTHTVAAIGRPVFECLQLYPQLVAPLFDAATPQNVIVFHAGDNDIAAGRDAVQTYAAFTAYVAAAHRQGWRVVVSTELRRWDFPLPLEIQLIEYNSLLRSNTAGADAIADLDTDPRLREKSYRSNPAVFTPDGVHPSNGGYAVIASMIVPVVKRLTGR